MRRLNFLYKRKSAALDEVKVVVRLTLQGVEERFNQTADRRSSSNHKIAQVQLKIDPLSLSNLTPYFPPDFNLFISFLLQLFIINHDWT